MTIWTMKVWAASLALLFPGTAEAQDAVPGGAAAPVLAASDLRQGTSLDGASTPTAPALPAFTGRHPTRTSAAMRTSTWHRP